MPGSRPCSGLRMTPECIDFLSRAGWEGAKALPLAGDASNRRYRRLMRADGTSAILMIAETATAADRASCTAFRHVGAHLRNLALSAPAEIAAYPACGFILMEDLGDTSLSKLVQQNSAKAQTAYRAAVGLLGHLRKSPPIDVPRPGPDDLAGMIDVAFAQLHDGGQGPTPLQGEVTTRLADALRTLDDLPVVLSLRDMHGDNLMWLPDRAGPARIGLLDYQDAMMLPDGYDLASLVDDVRRDIPLAWRDALIAEFARETDLSECAARVRIDVLSLQRNIRILGVFRRLMVERGKPGYARFVSRTRTLIERAVSNPALAGIAPYVDDFLARTARWGEA